MIKVLRTILYTNNNFIYLFWNVCCNLSIMIYVFHMNGGHRTGNTRVVWRFLPTILVCNEMHKRLHQSWHVSREKQETPTELTVLKKNTMTMDVVDGVDHIKNVAVGILWFWGCCQNLQDNFMLSQISFSSSLSWLIFALILMVEFGDFIVFLQLWFHIKSTHFYISFFCLVYQSLQSSFKNIFLEWK